MIIDVDNELKELYYRDDIKRYPLIRFIEQPQCLAGDDWKKFFDTLSRCWTSIEFTESYSINKDPDGRMDQHLKITINEFDDLVIRHSISKWFKYANSDNIECHYAKALYLVADKTGKIILDRNLLYNIFPVKFSYTTDEEDDSDVVVAEIIFRVSSDTNSKAEELTEDFTYQVLCEINEVEKNRSNITCACDTNTTKDTK